MKRVVIITQAKYDKFAWMFFEKLSWKMGNFNCDVLHDHDELNWQECDLVVSLLYNRIVKENQFDLPRLGTINIHPSFLPYHRGSAPNFWAVLCGYGAGWTAHRMTSEIDRGDIYLQKEVPVLLSDTAETLWNRLFDELPSFLSELTEIVSSGNLTALDVTQDVSTVNKMKDFHDAHEFGNALHGMNEDQRFGAYTVLNLIQACSFTGYEGFIMDTPDGRVEFTARKLND